MAKKKVHYDCLTLLAALDGSEKLVRCEIHGPARRDGSTLVAWYPWESKSSCKYRFKELSQRIRYLRVDWFSLYNLA